MIMAGEKLRNLPVETESGARLGRVVDFEFDTDEHLIATFIVRPSMLTRPIMRAELRIHRSQVISVTPKLMVVEDNVQKLKADARRTRESITKDVVPAVPAQTRGSA